MKPLLAIIFLLLLALSVFGSAPPSERFTIEIEGEIVGLYVVETKINNNVEMIGKIDLLIYNSTLINYDIFNYLTLTENESSKTLILSHELLQSNNQIVSFQINLEQNWNRKKFENFVVGQKIRFTKTGDLYKIGLPVGEEYRLSPLKPYRLGYDVSIIQDAQGEHNPAIIKLSFYEKYNEIIVFLLYTLLFLIPISLFTRKMNQKRKTITYFIILPIIFLLLYLLSFLIIESLSIENSFEKVTNVFNIIIGVSFFSSIFFTLYANKYIEKNILPLTLLWFSYIIFFTWFHLFTFYNTWNHHFGIRPMYYTFTLDAILQMLYYLIPFYIILTVFTIQFLIVYFIQSKFKKYDFLYLFGLLVFVFINLYIVIIGLLFANYVLINRFLTQERKKHTLFLTTNIYFILLNIIHLMIIWKDFL
ncbi:MAG: hypothetical protein ACMXYF_02090 [Candidatus Woesearchaeota archaeon]